MEGDEDDDDEDLEEAVNVLLTTAELAAARLPAATLEKVGEGGATYPDDAWSAVVSMPAARGRQRAVAAAAAVVAGTSPAVAAAFW